MRFGMIVVLVLGVASVGLAGAESFRFDAKGLSSLVLEHEAGEVVLRGGDVDQLTVAATKVKGSKDCKTTAERKGDRVRVVTEEDAWFSKACNVDLTIVLPRALDVDASIGASAMRVEGVAGALEVKVGAGTLEGTVATKALEVKLGAGTVDLQWEKPVAAGYSNIKVGAGAVTLRYPKSMVVATDVTTGLGAFDSAVRVDPEAAYRVEATIGMGQVSLRY